MGRAGGAITRSQWLGFFALCLLSASGWLIDDTWPSPLLGPEREGLHDLVIAGLLCAVSWRSLTHGNLRARPWMKLALASICLLGVPAMVAETTLGAGSQVTVSALFALLPVIVVVLVSYLDFDKGSSGAGRLLMPALIGLGGTLFLLPFVEPRSWRQIVLQAAVVFSVLVAATASVWMYRLLRGFPVLEAAVICCLANVVFAVVLSVAIRLTTRPDRTSSGFAELGWRGFVVEAATAILFGLPQIVLLVWLLREVAPVRFAARYLVVPLLTVIESYAIVRAPVTLRVAAGTALVIFAAWRLMTASQHDEEPGLMLR
jgi:hypothetical protein